MDNLARALLGGVAFSTLAVLPAVAGNAPSFHIWALHPGRAVNKTVVHDKKHQHITYTIGISTSVTAADLHKVISLAATFYKFSSYTDVCNNPRQKITAQKKSTYGKIRTATETYTSGDCANVFYGDTYELKNKSGFGQTDSFVSTLYGWFKGSSGAIYKGTLNLDVDVAIGN